MCPVTLRTDLGGGFGDEPVWGKPLVGFCRGDDPLFEVFKAEAVGPEHWTPLEAYREVFSDDACAAGEVSVVSWVLPHTERHVAYACGLGTFGLCDGLITPVGKAVRLGSVVVRAKLASSSRPYSRHDAYCPFLVDGSCGACMARCPVGAITPEGHDKAKCRTFSGDGMAAYLKETFDFEGYGCGLCQTGVPCEKGIPRKKGK